MSEFLEPLQVSWPAELYQLLGKEPGSALRVGVSDVETNGLLEQLDVVHCGGIIDASTGELRDWDPSNIAEMSKELERYDIVVGHNFLSFDRHAIRKVYPKFKCPMVLDTLVLCKMI